MLLNCFLIFFDLSSRKTIFRGVVWYSIFCVIFQLGKVMRKYILIRSWRKHLAGHLQLLINFFKSYFHVGTGLSFALSLHLCVNNIILICCCWSVHISRWWSRAILIRIHIGWGITFLLSWLLDWLLGYLLDWGIILGVRWRRRDWDSAWNPIWGSLTIGHISITILNSPGDELLCAWRKFALNIAILLASLHVNIVEDSLWRTVRWLLITSVDAC